MVAFLYLSLFHIQIDHQAPPHLDPDLRLRYLQRIHPDEQQH